MQSGGASDANSNSYANGFTNGDSDAYPYANGNTYGYSHTDGDANCNAYGQFNRYCYSNSDGNANSHADANKAQPNAHSNCYGDSHYHAVQLRFRTGLLEKPCRVAGHPIAAWQRDLQSG